MENSIHEPNAWALVWIFRGEENMNFPNSSMIRSFIWTSKFDIKIFSRMRTNGRAGQTISLGFIWK
jgi:hypothetical protein